MKSKASNYNLLLLIVVIVWGGGFVAVEYLQKANWNTNLIITTRFFIATITLFLIFFKKILTINKEEILFGFSSGILIYIAFFMQTIGQSHTNLSNVAFFTATNVIMIPFITWIMNKKRPSIKIFMLCFMCLIGVGILNFKNGGFVLKIGDLLALLSAFFFALQISFLDRITKITDPIKINFLQIFFTFLISGLVLIVSNESYTSVDIRSGIKPILFLGLFSTSLCYFLQTYAQKYTDAMSAGIIMSLEAFFASIFSVILGIELLSKNLIVGGFFIILSTILVNFKNEVKN
ncbi:DMT family transporter [Oceanivirga salmonicida]|uniref:DMT family transporter n=1 Tax=Oceanivirga salmonicida TaxID=1769291 RepID=UPI00083781EA|nr:DMT family transporter [Oceanivirga salmonicida]